MFHICHATPRCHVLFCEFLFNLCANLREVLLHAFGIALLDNLKEFLQLTAYVLDLTGGAGVEEDFLQQVVVFAKQSFGNGHVLLEGGARCLLLLHDGREHEGGHEGDGERVGHGLIVLVKGVLEDVEPEALVQVLEEHLAQVVALADDDGILIAQVAQAGECGSEHGVCAHEAEATLAIELGQLCLYRSDIAQYAVLGQCGYHLLEGLDGVLYCGRIDDKLGSELAYLVKCGEAASVVHEAQALRVDVIHCCLVLETQQVGKEGAHLAGSEDENFHKRKKKPPLAPPRGRTPKY